MSGRSEHTPISFPYNPNKAAQAILWLLNSNHGSMDKLKLVKLIFYADRAHLSKYGRPIVGGNYVAMPHGLVSSPMLDSINSATPEASLPFVLRDNYICLKETIGYDELSESDREILQEVLDKYGHYNPWQLRDLTHELQAYKKNYPDPTANTSRPLSYDDFFLDLKSTEMLDIIRERQEVVDFLS